MGAPIALRMASAVPTAGLPPWVLPAQPALLPDPPDRQRYCPFCLAHVGWLDSPERGDELSQDRPALPVHAQNRAAPLLWPTDPLFPLGSPRFPKPAPELLPLLPTVRQYIPGGLAPRR